MFRISSFCSFAVTSNVKHISHTVITSNADNKLLLQENFQRNMLDPFEVGFL